MILNYYNNWLLFNRMQAIAKKTCEKKSYKLRSFPNLTNLTKTRKKLVEFLKVIAERHSGDLAKEL